MGFFFHPFSVFNTIKTTLGQQLLAPPQMGVLEIKKGNKKMKQTKRRTFVMLGIERIERKGSERQHCGKPYKYDKCENEEKCGFYCDMAPHW